VFTEQWGSPIPGRVLDWYNRALELDDHKRLARLERNWAIYFVTSSTYERFVLPDDARKIALDSFRYLDGTRYKLFAAVVMPDHFHLLLQPMKDEKGEFHRLSLIMNSLKGYSSHKIKELLARELPVWQERYFDTIIRGSTHFREVIDYIIENPEKAGLVLKGTDYRFLWTPSMKFLFEQ
jgi:REP element-mobilizing transposase RayT